jgi:DNA polymerase
MLASEKSALWDELSVVEDWLGGGLRRDRPRPEFADTPAPEPSAGVVGPGSHAAAMGPEDRALALKGLEREVAICTACRLCSGRTHPVFGQGVASPLVLVVGEGPGAEEDASGLPFVGPAGKLLDKMLAAIGLSRESNAFIANVVKCRPPSNRDPAPDESAACMPYLERQIGLLSPQYILCLGRTATRALTGSEEGITRLRGRFFDWHGIPLVGTYHPSAILRDESLKRPAWEDLKALKERLTDVGIH